ncbi:E1-E2 ATPase family protein [Mycobacterium xenopi 4042]|uniref:E1-E2 ATPase family protein n=1 Tax=Mycobacterium xenopi 4042 TaxID=1299334 RepID=X8CM15_MYCXE|nr:E1-E2 ATPase family protein [Mycobacterium xenopi 4042]
MSMRCWSPGDDRQRASRWGAAVTRGACGRRAVRRTGTLHAPCRRPGDGDDTAPLGRRPAHRTHGHGAASSLRPGDIIDLAAPEVVPADARLLVAEDLEVDESLLTGESLPVDKQVEPVAADDPDRPACCSRAAPSSPGTRAPSSSPPGRRPRRNARSPRFPTSNRQPACRRGCGS